MSKKTFYLHVDSLAILDQLTDEQCGQLFRLIYNYHNPNKPKETEITQLVNLVFHPFKYQFERDLQKYEVVCERNKINGKNGGRPKIKTQRNPKNHDKDKEKDKDKDKDKEKDKDNKNVYSEFVKLTHSEYEKLISDFGKDQTDWMINKLNVFKGSNGKKYKSDYLAILNWVVKAYKEEKEKSSVKKEKNGWMNPKPEIEPKRKLTDV